MKVLYIITKSEAGGAQTHISQLSKHLAENGHSVGVMAQPGGWLESEVRSTKYEVRFLPNQHLQNSFNPVHGWRAMREVKKAVADFKPDLVSCHSSIAGFWARLAIRNKIPTLFTAHGWAFTEGAPSLRRQIGKIAEKLAAKYCNKIICVSNYDRNLALRYKIAPKEKLVTVHNGVEIHGTWSMEHGTKEKSKIKIVFVGRLAKPKMPEVLIEAFGEMPSEICDKAEILIVGDGPKKENLKLKIRNLKLNNVKLLGDLEREKVFEVLAQSDIFVLVSRYEGLPRSVLEAMSAGLPIIASDVGGISEMVNLENGFLISKNSISALQSALKKLIMDKELRVRMGKASRRRAESEFSLEKMIKKTFKVYEQERQN